MMTKFGFAAINVCGRYSLDNIPLSLLEFTVCSNNKFKDLSQCGLGEGVHVVDVHFQGVLIRIE